MSEEVLRIALAELRTLRVRLDNGVILEFDVGKVSKFSDTGKRPGVLDALVATRIENLCAAIEALNASKLAGADDPQIEFVIATTPPTDR